MDRFGIPTRWHGVLFRSKLEVYVAQRLEDYGIKFVYEPEAFREGSVSYLPDFYLEQQDCLLEVKPFRHMDEVDSRRDLIQSIGKQFVAVDFNHQDGIVPLLMFGHGEACDPANCCGHDDPANCKVEHYSMRWSDCSDIGDIYLDKRKFPCPFFTIGHGCKLRWAYGDDCTCTR
jgi:hypothetical protein